MNQRIKGSIIFDWVKIQVETSHPYFLDPFAKSHTINKNTFKSKSAARISGWNMRVKQSDIGSPGKFR